MKRIIPAIVAVALVALAFQFVSDRNFSFFNGAAVTSSANNVEIQHLTDANFEQVLKDSKTIVLVDFWAPWCGPCRAVAPAVQELANKYEGKVLVVKVNVDNCPKASSGIRSIPTVRLYAPGGGKVLDTRVGASRDSQANFKNLEDMVKPHLPKDNGN